jgi:hypothetical protein
VWTHPHLEQIGWKVFFLSRRHIFKTFLKKKKFQRNHNFFGILDNQKSTLFPEKTDTSWENPIVTVFYWNSQQIFSGSAIYLKTHLFLLFYLKIFKITKCKKKIYGIIAFYIKTDFPISNNVKNWGKDFFLNFLSFANFFHFSDENLPCEHEPNKFFLLNLAK